MTFSFLEDLIRTPFRLKLSTGTDGYTIPKLYSLLLQHKLKVCTIFFLEFLLFVKNKLNAVLINSTLDLKLSNMIVT